MDRLVCGDVGYGKTEVALRAALKAVLGGKQVAVLAPTTVLVEQHALTFAGALRRAAGQAWQSLSRFKAQERAARGPEGPADGKVDVVVGTHRLLSTDVRFKDLGLLVIDEEQRFGVTHKERLKKLRDPGRRADADRDADPAHAAHGAHGAARPLDHHDAAGRPPGDPHLGRRATTTTLVVEGVKRELARGGQIFFVHNRVEDIHKWADEAARARARGADASSATGRWRPTSSSR